MIHHLNGKLVEKNPTHLIVECSGVGYFLNISLHTFSKIKDEENILIFTHLIVREDAHILYGFADRFEREMFELLLTVSGVGANTARTIFSSMSPEQVKNAILHEDALSIQKVKGIGAKTAQRIILDLKDKIIKVYPEDVKTEFSGNTIRNEALSALEVLGYPKKQTEKIIDKIISESPEEKIEDVLKRALKNL
ncbi:MAG: Holliday junction branch migration protein RuvA [Bacteroidetes bacterium]|nr:Holliday junction branch migration protein RuvA [Bacteroidota bacterium]